jgi:hypothetical protein
VGELEGGHRGFGCCREEFIGVEKRIWGIDDCQIYCGLCNDVLLPK